MMEVRTLSPDRGEKQTHSWSWFGCIFKRFPVLLASCFLLVSTLVGPSFVVAQELKNTSLARISDGRAPRDIDELKAMQARIKRITNDFKTRSICSYGFRTC